MKLDGEWPAGFSASMFFPLIKSWLKWREKTKRGMP
jgi:hypothetical protein